LKRSTQKHPQQNPQPWKESSLDWVKELNVKAIDGKSENPEDSFFMQVETNGEPSETQRKIIESELVASCHKRIRGPIKKAKETSEILDKTTLPHLHPLKRTGKAPELIRHGRQYS